MKYQVKVLYSIYKDGYYSVRMFTCNSKEYAYKRYKKFRNEVYARGGKIAQTLITETK